MRTWVLALLAPALAGCLAAPAPVPVPPAVEAVLHQVAEVVPLEVEAPDGAVLRGHVYLPDGDGPFAPVLLLSPYWSNLQPATDQLLVEKDGRRLPNGVQSATLENLTLRGFALAAMSVRGTGMSGGCYEFLNPLGEQDGRAIIEALAAQPWSTGKVGMFGGSYAGWTQDVVLRDPPPQLAAIVPYSSVLDAWGIVTRHGAPLLGGPALGPLWTSGVGLGTYSVVATNGVNNNPRPPTTSLDHVCDASVGSQQPNLDTAWNGDKTAYWGLRDNRAAVAGAPVPTLVANGLTDNEGHILQADDRWSLMQGPKHMLLGQWGHSAQATVRTDYPQLVVGWFDHWLRSGPALVQDGIVEYQDDDGGWHASAAWPPAGNATTLHLAGRGLAPEPGAAEPQLAVSANEVDPSLAVCGPHHALWVSPPLAEDVLLAGHFHVNLSLTSTLPDGNLAVYLFRTPGSGACPDLQGREVRRALTDLRHRGSLEVGADFPVGSAGQVDVRSHPFAAQVSAGERLVLSVGGGSTELQPRPFKPVLRIEGGSLTLTAVEGELRFA